MLSWLITRLRFYGAITLVALYTVCAIMPPVASAIPRGGTSSHCLTGDRHGVSDVQHGINDGIGTLGDTLRDGAIGKHAGNSVDRDDGNNPKWHAGACCSLFSCAAIIGELRRHRRACSRDCGPDTEPRAGAEGEPWSVIQLPMVGVAPINFRLARNKTLRSGGQPLSPSAGDHNLLLGKE